MRQAYIKGALIKVMKKTFGWLLSGLFMAFVVRLLHRKKSKKIYYLTKKDRLDIHRMINEGGIYP